MTNFTPLTEFFIKERDGEVHHVFGSHPIDACYHLLERDPHPSNEIFVFTKRYIRAGINNNPPTYRVFEGHPNGAEVALIDMSIDPDYRDGLRGDFHGLPCSIFSDEMNPADGSKAIRC